MYSCAKREHPLNSFVLPAATLWQRELVRFWRQKSRVLGVVASPLVFWLLIGYGSNDLARFYSGSLVLTVMFSAIFSTISIIEDRREGFLLSMLVSPAPRTSLVLGKILGSATLAWIQGLIFLVFRPAGRRRASACAELIPVAAAIFLISFTLTGLGFVIAWKMDSTPAFTPIMNLLLVPMWMVSGALFPMATAHGVDQGDHVGQSADLFDRAAESHAAAAQRLPRRGGEPDRHRGFGLVAAAGLRRDGRAESHAQRRMKRFAASICCAFCLFLSLRAAGQAPARPRPVPAFPTDRPDRPALRQPVRSTATSGWPISSTPPATAPAP